MNNNEYTVKTSSARMTEIKIVAVLGLLTLLFIIYMLMKDGEGNGGLSLFLGVFILPVIGLLYYVYKVKDDTIRVDQKGITLDVHSDAIIPKHYQASYRWSELSSYSINVRREASTSCYGIELYGADESLLREIKLQSLMGDEIWELERYLVKHLLPKPLYDFNQNGKVTFPAKRSKTYFVLCGVFFLITVAFIPWFVVQGVFVGEDSVYAYILLGFFFLLGLFILYAGVVSQRDSLTIDSEGIEVDVHSKELCKHTKQKVAYDSFEYFQVDSSVDEYQLILKDKDHKEILSCNCSNLCYANYLEMVLKVLLTE